jgi:hypothetical protein
MHIININSNEKINSSSNSSSSLPDPNEHSLSRSAESLNGRLQDKEIVIALPPNSSNGRPQDKGMVIALPPKSNNGRPQDKEMVIALPPKANDSTESIAPRLRRGARTLESGAYIKATQPPSTSSSSLGTQVGKSTTLTFKPGISVSLNLHPFRSPIFGFCRITVSATRADCHRVSRSRSSIDQLSFYDLLSNLVPTKFI